MPTPGSLAARCRAPSPAVRWASRVDAWPASAWLGLQMLAAWPVLWWSARRVADGSDEPLGLLALGLLGLAAFSGRAPVQRHARDGWLAGALAATVARTLALGTLPMLACGLLAALAFGCTWAAYRVPGTPVAPVLGLLGLALPVMASLQFYAGYPLRLLTAQCSAWLLQAAGLAAEPSGASLVVAGRLVIVDAPCSGVQLAWMAYCTACAAALWRGLPDRMFLRRLPVVGITVLLGNIVRNSVLVAREAGALAWPAWTHDAAGLVVLALVCWLALALMKREEAVDAAG